MSQMTNGIVNFRTYLETCSGKLLFLDLYTPISHEKLYGQLVHVYILKIDFFLLNVIFDYSMVLQIYANPNKLVYGVTSQVCMNSNNNTLNSGGVTH